MNHTGSWPEMWGYSEAAARKLVRVLGLEMRLNLAEEIQM